MSEKFDDKEAETVIRFLISKAESVGDIAKGSTEKFNDGKIKNELMSNEDFKVIDSELSRLTKLYDTDSEIYEAVIKEIRESGLSDILNED